MVQGEAKKKLIDVGGVTRLELGDFIADILEDRRIDPPIFHWVVQKVRSADIIDGGQEATFDEAEVYARMRLADLSRDQRLRKASGQ